MWRNQETTLVNGGHVFAVAFDDFREPLIEPVVGVQRGSVIPTAMAITHLMHVDQHGEALDHLPSPIQSPGDALRDDRERCSSTPNFCGQGNRLAACL
ncbi:hypothetical protein SKAU_G00337910 [Synaphobranchus kaupii]|uniref:Uncharacterized protein n=1 Tax=Synaphobranchus kaupii TaxID=118154 RepID=A0A9Q1EML6_SYNKA|nr:hypothetical protein SKAU_G00337910 [Synaphobranchus kaupii]